MKSIGRGYLPSRPSGLSHFERVDQFHVFGDDARMGGLMHRAIVISIFLTSLFLSFGLAADPKADWQHEWWVQKTVRALRGGAGPGLSDNFKAWLALPREQLVSHLVNDPLFADTLLSFNLSFLGFPVDRIREENGNYNNNLYSFPHAISSVRDLLQGGDYFSLMQLEHPYYFPPLNRPRVVESGDEKLDNLTLRTKNGQRLLKELDDLIAQAQANPAPSIQDLCAGFQQHTLDLQGKYGLGMLYPFIRLVQFSGEWYWPVTRGCFNPSRYSVGQFITGAQAVRAKVAQFLANINDYDPTRYKTTTPLAIRTLDLNAIGLNVGYNQFTYTVANELQNSSTNMNRKRSSYFLNRYFCDNLTPVNVEIPMAHPGNRHASDPSCMACHYKLDPLAGFFRDYGRQFGDYTGSRNISFDDNVTVKLADYVTNWKLDEPAATGRIWDVGYVRSTKNESQNDYGETLSDLFSILRRAPEVKRCLVQRMFEYFVSDSQAVDGDYLDYLTEQFSASGGSADAIRTLASNIVLSQAFSTQKPDSEQCYDHRPGISSQDGPPCRVASILNKYCTGCHSSLDKSPYLDLKHWQKSSGGAFAFPHQDDSGQNVDANTSFQQIADRLSSTNDNDRMPYLSDMPSNDRQALYVWASKQIKAKP